jgi:hypothetical protein
VCTNSYHAIISNSSTGPIFGGGYDIFISSFSNANRESHTNFGNSYKHADYQYLTEKAESILAGSYKFQTLEIEVFVLTN